MNKYYQLIEAEDVSELYIFGDIVDEAWCENDVEGASLCKQIQNIKSKQINVYINSYGGSVSSGLAIYNTLKAHDAKVTTYCQGFGCSIASVIFMAGDERIMSDASLLMIHNAWTICQGNAKDLRKQADDLDKITQASVRAYMSCVNISEEELVELLDNESWLTAEECLEMGFATEVIKDEVEAVSQSVRKSLIDMIMAKCKTDDDKKKCQEDDSINEKVLRCPECEFEGEMPMDEDGYYVCPECGYRFKEDDMDDDMDNDIDDDMNDEMDEKCDPKKDKKKNKQGTELKVMSSFLNLFN